MNRRTRAIVVVCAAAFLAFLDTTIVNVSFPNIAPHFPEASRSELSWVLDAYFIVIAAFLVPAGELADRLGALALAIVEGETWGWASGRILGLLALAAALVAVLVRRCLTHPRPIVDPALMAALLSGVAVLALTPLRTAAPTLQEVEHV
jgi:MFS family permease